jgi:26S proteasome regulatory subunit N6
VEIAHVAKLINLPEHTVEKKLSQMILDKRINGILDQGAGCLIINESGNNDKSFEKGMEVITNMSEVVDLLFARAKKVAKSAT